MLPPRSEVPVSESPILELAAVTRRYREDRAPVLDTVSFQLPRGAYVAIMGESGVGKSTLLNLIAGLDRPDTGRIVFDGRDLGVLDDDAATLLRRREMGFVFQAFHVLPYLTVEQNAALPLQLLGVPRDEQRSRVREMLAAVGLGEYGSRYPRELSGGEVQRVAIARALIHRPKLLLADEPTGNLDPRTATQILALLREQVRANAGSAVLITHSRAAAASADRVYVLDGRRINPVEPDESVGRSTGAARA
jgi:putative ABC transport system ATP-binding protein